MCNKIKIRKFLTIDLLILSILMPQVLSAQGTATTEKEEKKESIIVLDKYVVSKQEDKGYTTKSTLSSAGRLSTSLLDTPQVIQIVNQELIQDLGADQMLGAVQLVAGGVVRRSFNPGDDQYIWGFRAGASLKDGIGLGSNGTGPMYDVDRVEVLKGPIAMTFGNSGFVGGAINYVSRTAGKVATTEFKTTLGSFSYKRGELHLTRPINSNLSYRLDLGATDSDYGPRRYSYYRDNFIGGGINYNLSKNARLVVDAALYNLDYNRSITFIDPKTFKVFEAPDSFSIDTASSKYPTKNFRATSSLQVDLGNQLSMNFFLGYINFNNNWVRPYPTDYNIATGIMKRITENYLTSSHSVITNLDFTKILKMGALKHTIAFGGANTFNRGDYDNYTFETSDLNVNAPGDGGTVATQTNFPNGTGHTKYGATAGSQSRVSSVYIQDTISILNDRAFLVAGYRWNDQLSNNPDAAAKVTAYNAPVTRYGVVYKITKDIALHVNDSQAFIFNGGVDYRNVPLVPSIGKQKEIGLKTELLNGALSLSATYFDIELTKVRTLFVMGPNDPIPGQQGIMQGGTQTNHGFELTAATSHKIGSGELGLIATYFQGDILNEFKMKPVGATNNTGSLLFKYSFFEGALKNFSLGYGINSQGSRLASKISQIPNSDFTRLPEYTTYNAFATYTRGAVRYQVNIDNIGDTKFVQGAELPFWIFTDPGRSVKVSVSYKF